MKISTRLILAFLIISGFIAILGSYSLYELRQISEPIDNELSLSISELSLYSQLDSHASLIRYYDEVLTQSARNYAFTGDQIWKTRYLQTEPLLLNQISLAIEKGSDIEKRFFENVEFANDELVKIEHHSIVLADQGDFEQAQQLLDSDEYWNYKQVYETGLRNYIEERGNKLDKVHVTSTQTLETITKSTSRSIDFSFITILIVVIATIAASVSFGIIISQTITKPLLKLKDASGKISRGNFSSIVPIEGDDETKELARTFNDMAKSLSKTIELERKLALAETNLKHERFSAIGELSSRIAHDLKNPIGVIRMQLDVIMHDAPDKFDDKTIQRMKLMQSSIERISKQVSDITTFVKTKDIELETVHVRDIIDSLIPLIVKPPDVVLNLPKNDFIFFCDPLRFSVVLQNLINNAIETIGNEKGTIDVEFIEKSQNVLVKVIDTGSGIPDENLEKIFDPLFTTKHFGTGLGLSSCKIIVEQHGGTISVTNNPTTFQITLPNKDFRATDNAKHV